MPDNIYVLSCLPGIQRDGTSFSSRNYIDGQWCRFYRGLPKKIGGYRKIFSNDEIPRGIYVISNPPYFNVYVGDKNGLSFVVVDENGNRVNGIIYDRTPEYFQSNEYNQWIFDTLYSTTDDSALIIAQATRNLGSINSQVETPIYYGNLNPGYDETSIPLIPTGLNSSGGFTIIGSFLFAFGNNGDVTWTQSNDVTTIVNSARVTGQKIVTGAQTRGGSYSPAGLFWSLDSVIRVYFSGPTSADFSFDTVTGESSILSSNSVIEHDSLFYWAGTDRFLVYNGVVQELPNSMNLNYFFDNLNYSQRQKVFAQKITKWGEIWWFYPSGNSTECDKAIIYNTRLQTWYDSTIYRSCGDFEEVFSYPIWGANTKNSDGKYNIWQHEYGTDEDQTDDSEKRTVSPIESYFETGSISWVAYDPASQRQNLDRWVDLFSVEPDFTGSADTLSGQGGNITLTVKGKEYARSSNVSSSAYTITPTTEKIDVREQRREMTLLFNSNEIGGDYEMGQVLIVARIGDVRS